MFFKQGTTQNCEDLPAVLSHADEKNIQLNLSQDFKLRWLKILETFFIKNNAGSPRQLRDMLNDDKIKLIIPEDEADTNSAWDDINVLLNL